MKSWPALESFYNQAGYNSQENDDRLSDLPQELLLLIISYLDMNEALTFSLVSPQCHLAWRCTPRLIFKKIETFENRLLSMGTTKNLSFHEDSARFVRRVDGILEKHLGTTIDELRIISGLDLNWQSHVDRWAAFAIDKQVKILEFNFNSFWRRKCVTRDDLRLHVCGGCLHLSPAFTSRVMSSLTSLCLKSVNVNDDFVDGLSHCCPLLESLCIEQSDCLTRICGSLKVRHLEIALCFKLEKIDISARKLRSFILYSHPIELRVEDAYSLIEMSIGSNDASHCVVYAFRSLSRYLSQLVFLNLRLAVHYTPTASSRFGKHNLVAMPNLQHLELQVGVFSNRSVLECTSFIAASSSIRKLSLKLQPLYKDYKRDFPIKKWVGFPLKRLATLELVGYVGQAIDLELAFFVFENAAMLEEVIVDFFTPKFPRASDNDKRQRLVMLQTKLPQGVKLTVK